MSANINSDDATWADTSADYRLLPPAAKTRDQLDAELAQDEVIRERLRAASGAPMNPPAAQFSLFELTALITYVAIGMSAAVWLPLKTLAFCAGLTALFVWLMMSVFPPDSRVVWMAWAGLISTFFAAAFVAVVA